MIRLPPRSTLMDTLVPSTPLFRSARTPAGGAADTSGRPRRRGRLRVGGLGGRLPGPARVLPRAAGQHLHLLGTARLLDGAADAGPVGRARTGLAPDDLARPGRPGDQIGRASCRERVCQYV